MIRLVRHWTGSSRAASPSPERKSPTPWSRGRTRRARLPGAAHTAFAPLPTTERSVLSPAATETPNAPRPAQSPRARSYNPRAFHCTRLPCASRLAVSVSALHRSAEVWERTPGGQVYHSRMIHRTHRSLCAARVGDLVRGRDLQSGLAAPCLDGQSPCRRQGARAPPRVRTRTAGRRVGAPSSRTAAFDDPRVRQGCAPCAQSRAIAQRRGGDGETISRRAIGFPLQGGVNDV